MGKINSNIFNLNMDSFKLNIDNSDEIINIDNDNIVVEEVYKNHADIFSSKSLESRSKLQIGPIDFKFIDVTKDNFSDNQYNILSNKNISMYISDGVYHFITTAGNIYKLTDRNLINIIINTPRPRKVVYDLKGESSSVYSMQLLANIIENIVTTSLEELICRYNYKYSDQNQAMYTLLLVFPIYEKLIYQNEYMRYINYEQKIHNIFKGIASEITPELYEQRKQECENEIGVLCDKLNIENCLHYNEFDLLNLLPLIKDNEYIYPSLNIELLYSIKLDEFAKIVDLYYEFHFIEEVLSNSQVYNTHDNGLLNTPNPLFSKNDDKILLRGSYLHLHQNILAELLNINKYIEYVNSDKNIYSEILNNNGRNLKDNIILLLEWGIHGYITGCKTFDDYKKYFYSHKFTILSDSDLESIINLLHTELSELLDLLDKSLSKIFTGQLILHGEFTGLNKYIFSSQRKLEKDLIIDVCDYINDFNGKNKAQIHFIGYYRDSIYIECEEGSLNVALDTLTRTMVRIYDRHLKKTKAHCLVENLNIK